MASSNDRRRILDMLAAGKVTADQAAVLLKALGPTPAESLPLPPMPRAPQVPRSPDPAFELARSSFPMARAPGAKRPRFVRIKVEATKAGGEATNVDVNVPYALAKFALRFLPHNAREELQAQGIDLGELLDTAAEDLAEGKIVDVDATEPGGDSTQITIEVI